MSNREQQDLDKQDLDQPYQRSYNGTETDSIKNQISALIDNEIELDDHLHLFAAIKVGNAAGESWQSYHLIGDAMRGNDAFTADFKARLMQKLANEPTVLAPNLAKDKSPKMKSAWSIAASVAAIGFVGWFALQQYGLSGTQAPQQIAESFPQDYLTAHQSTAPSNAGYFVQDVTYTESK